MTPKAETPAAVVSSSGGDRDVLAGAVHAEHTPPLGSVTGPSCSVQALWLGQVVGDARQGNAAFRAAWTVSRFLCRRGGERAATLGALDALAVPSRSAAGASKWPRQALLSLESGAHLWINRSTGRGPGRAHPCALIVKGRLV